MFDHLVRRLWKVAVGSGFDVGSGFGLLRSPANSGANLNDQWYRVSCEKTYPELIFFFRSKDEVRSFATWEKSKVCV